MNDQTPTDSSMELPVISQERIDRIENAVFDDIGRERTPNPAPPARARRRRRGWLTGAGIAAAFVAGVLITPPLLDTVGVSTAEGGGGVVGLVERSSDDMAVPESVDGATSSATDAATESATREIIATAQASVRVDDIEAAVAAISALAEARGGYVESTDVSADPTTTDDVRMPEQPAGGYGWISIRVPSADLTSVIDDLGDTGVVVSSSLSKQDVTSTAVDLRARVEATRASVARLTELMAQSASVSELIEAEVALTDRQAQLESYEQQLAALEDQVAMSTLQVQLTPEPSATDPEPDGFGAGLLAGWNGLIVSLNALVITLGFLLPWLGIAVVVIAVIWFIRRRRRTRIDPQNS